MTVKQKTKGGKSNSKEEEEGDEASSVQAPFVEKEVNKISLPTLDERFL